MRVSYCSRPCPPCSALCPEVDPGDGRTPREGTQLPGSIQASGSEAGGRGDQKRAFGTRKSVRGNRKRGDTGNPAPAAVTNTIQSADTPARTPSGKCRPTPQTSKAPRPRSGWSGFGHVSSGFLPGPLGHFFGH